MPSRAPAEMANVRARRTATGSSTPAPARSSCSTTQLRPAFLAAYRARSARSTRPAGSASRGSFDAAPTETVSGNREPRMTAGVSSTASPHALARRQQVVTGGEAGQQHDELLAAPARQRVVAAQRVGDAPRDVHEHLVADGVAVQVVQHLEVVDVDGEQPGAGALPAGAGQLRLERLGEVAAVERAGERVDPGQAVGLLPRGLERQQRLLLGRHVGEDALGDHDAVGAQARRARGRGSSARGRRRRRSDTRRRPRSACAASRPARRRWRGPRGGCTRASWAPDRRARGRRGDGCRSSSRSPRCCRRDGTPRRRAPRRWPRRSRSGASARRAAT